MYKYNMRFFLYSIFDQKVFANQKSKKLKKNLSAALVRLSLFCFFQKKLKNYKNFIINKLILIKKLTIASQ